MTLYIIISIISLLALVVIHELGHFLVAKKLGVKVEEFGIGIPPRIFGKKIGETIYSLNLLPIGAFVKIYGEDKQINDKQSFSQKTIFERSLIILAGVVAFWIVAFILLTFMATMKSPVAISEDINDPNARVMILATEKNSIAESAGIISGDIVKNISSQTEFISINNVNDFRNFLTENRGENLILTIQRGQEIIELPTVSFEENGFLGVHISRIIFKSYPWYQAPIQGFIMTGRVTYNIVSALFDTFVRAITGRELSEDVKFVGPVGIVTDVFTTALESGLRRYLEIMVIISISLAIFNLLPIPALDGGRFLLLLIEKIKGRPINQKIEQGLIAVSFIMLIGLFIIVTIYDIKG